MHCCVISHLTSKLLETIHFVHRSTAWADLGWKLSALLQEASAGEDGSTARGWNHLTAHSLICMVAGADCWLGPGWDWGLQHPCLAPLHGCLAFSQHGRPVPKQVSQHSWVDAEPHFTT